MTSVSVIVPVRNRRTLLRRVLDALAQQTLADHEVIVVDDGSTDGSGDEALRDGRAGRPVRVLTTRGGSSGAARDVGAAAATAPYLAFTDSDCVPAPDWLERGVGALEDGADMVQGVTRPLRPCGPLERSVWVTREDGLYPTCNLFVRRDSFEKAGGFVESAEALSFRPGSGGLALAFGADSLLGWRVKRSGTAVFRPDVVVEHHVFPFDLRDAISRAWIARGFPMLVREAPELRDTLLRRRVVLGSGARLWLYAATLLAALGCRRTAGLALGALVGSHAYRRTVSMADRRSIAQAVALDLGLDVVTTVALIVGSAQARTVVL